MQNTDPDNHLRLVEKSNEKTEVDFNRSTIYQMLQVDDYIRTQWPGEVRMIFIYESLNRNYKKNLTQTANRTKCTCKKHQLNSSPGNSEN